MSCVPGAIVAMARKCSPLEPSEAVWRTTTQLASPGGARFFTNSLPTYVWKRVRRPQNRTWPYLAGREDRDDAVASHRLPQHQGLAPDAPASYLDLRA